MMTGVLLLVALNLWVAWRFSRQPIGQDLGIWMLWGFTGARPYRDYVDCKPPGIHLWCWLLSRVSGRRLRLAQFLHHVAIGGFAIAAYRLTGRLDAGLLFTALAQSAWLHAYLTWLEPMAAGLLMLALLLGPWPSTICLALCVFFDLKLAPSAFLLFVLRGWWLPLGVAALSAAALLAVCRLLWPAQFAEVWYGAVTVARRIARQRRQGGQRIRPSWGQEFAMPLLLVAPAVAAAAWTRPDPVLWAVLATYVCVNLMGRVWRPYHWLPLAACAVAAPPEAALVLAAEWIASGLYLGDLLRRTRPTSAPGLLSAQALGQKLRSLPGTLWVDGESTQIYVYAHKQPAWTVEQVEIRWVIPERRAWDAGREPPELLVVGPRSLPLLPPGYRPFLVHGPFTVLLAAGRRGALADASDSPDGKGGAGVASR
jgi:hypothetical protein